VTFDGTLRVCGAHAASAHTKSAAAARRDISS
jgi:hypothetical protein